MEERTPKRIYGWQNSQLSIARHYGGISFNGAQYLIAPNEEGQPLVRIDYWRKEKAARKKKTAPAEELPLQPNAGIEPARSR